MDACPTRGDPLSWVDNCIAAEIAFQLQSAPSWHGHWQPPALSLSLPLNSFPTYLLSAGSH